MSLARQRSQYMLTTKPIAGMARRERLRGEEYMELARLRAEAGEHEKARAADKSAKAHLAKYHKLAAKVLEDERLASAEDEATARFVTTLMIEGDLPLKTIAYLAWSEGYFAKPPKSVQSLRRFVNRHWRGLKKRGPKGGQK